jgi:4-hydroxyphenylpyruvate dioxygenase
VLLFQPFRDFEAAPRARMQKNFDRAQAKFDIMEQLGCDLMLVCSNTAPDAIDDDAVAAEDLRGLGARAAQRGFRIGYEALAWGRNVKTYRHVWKIVQAADHPAVGMIVDSFHTFAIDDDDAPIAKLPGEKIFFTQLADAPLMRLDPLSWSRHFRNFPGQGAMPVTRFTRNVLASGYSGPISLEIFNDEFRAAPPRPTAVDAMRSLLLLEEELLAPADGAPAAPTARVFASPPPPVCHGVEFIEFAVDHDTRPRLADMFGAMGFAHVGTHRSKDVTLYRQGGVNFVLNAEKDSFAHSYFLLHGPSVCALAFRTNNVGETVERAVRYRAQTFRGRVGPNELVIPAIRGLDGSLIYLVDRAGAAGTIYDVDFVAEPTTTDAVCGLTRIDHVSQVMPRGKLDGTVLFYKSVFGFEAEPAHELVDPYGLIQSRVLESRDRTVRLPLNATASPRTATARFLATYSGAGVHHIAIATDDIFATMAAMRARQVPLLEIPATYYDGLSAMHDLSAERIDQLRELAILYDRSETGEFFHAYTHTFDGRFFFEIVQRQNYEGFGAVNASVRLAAQALSERGEYSLDVLGELAL